MVVDLDQLPAKPAPARALIEWTHETARASIGIGMASFKMDALRAALS